MRHNDVAIFCPHHGCPLRATGWRDKLDDFHTDSRNQRLIYDLNGNLPRPSILRAQPLIAWE